MSSGGDDGPLLGTVVSLVSPLAPAAGSRYSGGGGGGENGHENVCACVCVCKRQKQKACIYTQLSDTETHTHTHTHTHTQEDTVEEGAESKEREEGMKQMSSQPIESKKKSSCFSGDVCDPAGNQEPRAIWEARVYWDLISCLVDRQTQYCSQR